MSNLVLDTLKFKKLLDLKGRGKRLETNRTLTLLLVQRKAKLKQCEYGIVLGFSSH